MTDRFDLEQRIMTCWNVTDDIDAVITAMERFSPGDVKCYDTVVNMLIGLKAIYQEKFEQLFESFENAIKNKNI